MNSQKIIFLTYTLTYQFRVIWGYRNVLSNHPDCKIHRFALRIIYSNYGYFVMGADNPENSLPIPRTTVLFRKYWFVTKHWCGSRIKYRANVVANLQLMHIKHAILNKKSVWELYTFNERRGKLFLFTSSSHSHFFFIFRISIKWCTDYQYNREENYQWNVWDTLMEFSEFERNFLELESNFWNLNIIFFVELEVHPEKTTICNEACNIICS